MTGVILHSGVYKNGPHIMHALFPLLPPSQKQGSRVQTGFNVCFPEGD